MSFLDDMDSVEEKLQTKRLSPMVLVGIVSVVLVLLFFALQAGCSALTSDDFQVQQSGSNPAQEEGDSGYSEVDAGYSEGVYGPEVVVYVTGEVNDPGVYTLQSGARVNDAVQAAGGPTAKAVLESLNLAELVSDGQQIIVPSKKMLEEQAASGTGSSAAGGSTVGGSSSVPSGKVNINTASLEELQTLRGIGPALAQRIVDYRQANGRFSNTVDLKKVSGIGEKTYESLAANICV